MIITPRTLIEAFLPPRGTLALDRVFRIAPAAGIADQPLRLALRRMASAGEITVTGRGRSGTAELTREGRLRLAVDRSALALAARQDDGEAAWSGTWWLASVSAPEGERWRRDALRRRLVGAGAAQVATGLYLSPHRLTELIEAEERELVVLARPRELEVRGVSDPAAIAEALWPAAPVIEGYAALDAALAGTPAAPDSVEEAHVAALRLADALERAMRTDPLVPPELRAQPWPPAAVRERWRARWAEVAARCGETVPYAGW